MNEHSIFSSSETRHRWRYRSHTGERKLQYSLTTPRTDLCSGQFSRTWSSATGARVDADSEAVRGLRVTVPQSRDEAVNTNNSDLIQVFVFWHLNRPTDGSIIVQKLVIFWLSIRRFPPRTTGGVVQRPTRVRDIELLFSRDRETFRKATLARLFCLPEFSESVG